MHQRLKIKNKFMEALDGNLIIMTIDNKRRPLAAYYLWFHEIRCTTNFATAWLGYIKELDLTSDPMPYQHVTLKYFETLIHYNKINCKGWPHTKRRNKGCLNV